MGAVNTNNEAGLGHFNIILYDDAGGTGDATGQMTYDMFNQPLVNSLAGTIDPVSTLDACPISKFSRSGAADPTQTGITGTIVTCPTFESDGLTPSPLAGQAVVANLMVGRYGVGKNGSKPTPWTARRHTILSSGSKNQATSKSMGRRDST